MKKETKLAVLKELIANSHDLCYSVYTPDLKLVSSSWDAEAQEGMDLLLAGVRGRNAGLQQRRALSVSSGLLFKYYLDRGF